MNIIMYFFCYSKDHQWTPGDGKNQQKIGIGNMNTAGSTWPNQPPTTGGAFGSVSKFILFSRNFSALKSQ